ncbi:MAG: prepilin-type N-terminal cleavage/methylation domain-containing protein [Lachnospiraceae bacterium]|nr:prepilin-type N-terminal cleavage/methylation domain-containing protein [Lachnospiraceae bacterium]
MSWIKKSLKNNKGFTLVEMLIVLGISAIILAILTYSYSVVSNADVEKASNRLESVLRSARVNAMSRGQAHGVVHFVSEGGTIYAEIGNGTSSQKKELICSSSITFTPKFTTDYATEAEPVDAGTMGWNTVFNGNGKLRLQGVTKTNSNLFRLKHGDKEIKVIVYAETGAIEKKY